MSILSHMNKTSTTWKFQSDDDTLVHGSPTDSRGLDIRRQGGVTHVHMNDSSGWLQIHVAIRKLGLAERLAVIR